MDKWDILSFSERVDWGAGIGHTIKQILRRVSTTRKVLNFNPPWEWRQAYRAPTKVYRIKDNLWHFEWGRLFPLFRRPAVVVRTMAFLRALAVRWLCSRLGIEQHIYLVWNPIQVPVVLSLPRRFTVYYAYDKFDAWHYDREEWRQETIRQENTLAQMAQVGIGVTEIISRSLREKGLPRVFTVPNGVEYEKFATSHGTTPPEDVAEIPHPCLGYVGGLSEYTAFSVLRDLAALRPYWHLVLVGPIRGMTSEQRAELEQLLCLPNVHYLGSKPYEDVPSYIRALDVGLAAFEERRGGGFAGSSLKVYEYLAAGLPVVASPIEDVIRMGDMVYTARTSTEWVAQIEHALREDAPELRRRRQEFARQHSWDNRAKQVLEIIEQAYQEWKGTQP